MRLGTNLMVLLNQMAPIYTPTFLKQNMQVHVHVQVFILSDHEELCQSCNISHRQINAFPFNSSFSYSNI